MSGEKLLQFFELAEVTDSAELRLRRAAVLLFAKDVRRWHPRSGITICRVSGTELGSGDAYNVTRRDEITTPLFMLLETAWAKFSEYIPLDSVSATETKAGIRYPAAACREALI